MYNKEDLTSKSVSELENIAKELGVEHSSTATEEELIYGILDKQAELESNKNPLETKRKRTRIIKHDRYTP